MSIEIIGLKYLCFYLPFDARCNGRAIGRKELGKEGLGNPLVDADLAVPRCILRLVRIKYNQKEYGTHLLLVLFPKQHFVVVQHLQLIEKSPCKGVVVG